ncbi:MULTISPECIES: MarR family winged helix-turn-helix transcriptional regulator [Acinetobacter]|uniref:MarR family winged helix-turn-helix transcriptional regulator n=1 Tax=Acinetobacter TaxID=469 RepID=UPI00143C1230|nr:MULTISPECIES: MarR family transcriptional regulator [Acinetobacter]MDD0803898.1 MarR family transcriptional regulator [Acinetobacter sp. Gutcm_16]NKG37424.1 MarR family transcriptional regulator [Acinetobacter johnsonii]
MADTPLLENRVCFAMYSATNAMVRQYRPRLQVYDLTYPQFIVLLALYEQDNVTLTEIGQKTFFDSGTLTPIIKKLEEKQFLKRVAVKEDERMKKVVLLEKALLAKDKIMAIPFELACYLGLDPDDLVAIHQLCQRFLNGLEQPQHVSRDT